MSSAKSAADEPHAFISYVREDSDAVDGLEAALVAAGIKVWRDKNDIGPGDDWKRVIRRAIQGNSLAFIPCFSTVGNERERSAMREEIHLAIEEYRLRPPDKPWILSVRFDECEVPDYDLVPGKTLRSLNWSDLFDKQYPANIVRLVDRVKALLGTPSAGAGAPAAVSDASDRVRGSLIATAVREGAADPARVPAADQQVRAEARKVVEAINDRDRFPTQIEPFKAELLLERLQAVTGLTDPLVEASVALGAYGQGSQARLATDVVNSLARAATGARNGIVPLLNIFRLPASLVMQAGALGAVATENAAMLNAFIIKPESTTEYGQTAPVHQLISPWSPYLEDLRTADLYAKTLNGVDVDPAAYDRPSQGGEYHWAPHVAMTVLLKPHIRDFTIDDPSYDALYFRTEVLVGAAIYDAAGPHGLDIKYHLADNWVGRHVVPERYSQTTVVDGVTAEFNAAGPNWWPLVGGALFGGDPDRAREALGLYAAAATSSRSRIRH